MHLQKRRNKNGTEGSVKVQEDAAAMSSALAVTKGHHLTRKHTEINCRRFNSRSGQHELTKTEEAECKRRLGVELLQTTKIA